MKKILLTCFLALPCLFQRARIKLKAIKERLGLPGPPTALRCIESLTYLAAGVFHVAQRSVSREAYLSAAIFHRLRGGVFHSDDKGGYFAQQYFGAAISREAYFPKKTAWIGTYALIPILLCSSISPTLSLVAQSPGAELLYRSDSPYRGGPSRPDSFTPLDDLAKYSDQAIYTTDGSAIDGGPILRSSDIRHRTSLVSPISRLPASTKETASLRAFARSDDPLHWESELSTVKASDIRHLTSDIKLNFGLVDSDQDMGAGEGTSGLQPTPFPVFMDQVSLDREVGRQNPNAEGLDSCFSCAERSRSMRLVSKKSSSVPVFMDQVSLDREVSRQNAEAQSLASCVLCLGSSSSLVDPDQDMGAGEGTSGLQPAPFPVLPNQIKKELARQAPESQSLVSSVLLLASDHLTSQRQEESIPSAQVGRFHLELPTHLAPDTVWVVFWEHFLKEHSDVTPGTRLPLVAEKGTFFEGGAGFKAYRWDLPEMQSPLTFSILSGKKQLIRYWTIFEGDQVRMRVDLEGGKSYFSGPSAPFFSALNEVDRLAEEQRFNTVPLMVTGNPEAMLSDSLMAFYFEQAMSLPGELYKVMDFLIPGKNESELLERYLSKPLDAYPLIQKLPGLRQGLDVRHAELISQRAYGEALFQIISKVKHGKSLLTEEQFSRRFEALQEAVPAFPQVDFLDPAYLSALYELTLLRGKLLGQPLNLLLAEYPDAVSDRIIGLYVLDRFKRLEGEQSGYLEKAMTEVETPWVIQLLVELQNSSLKGVPLQTEALIDSTGNLFHLEDLKGKSMVLSFWISGCKFCIRYYQETLKQVFEEFKDREDVVFVSINADQDQLIWKRETLTWKYSHPEMIHLHQDAGTGILANYRVGTFPQKMLVDSDHRLFLLTTNQYSPGELADKIRNLLDSSKSFNNP